MFRCFEMPAYGVSVHHLLSGTFEMLAVDAMTNVVDISKVPPYLLSKVEISFGNRS